jgi:histidinol phosphatase-like PHP family hydrolase
MIITPGKPMAMKKLLITLIPVFLFTFHPMAQGRMVRVGEIQGYTTLKCDFHTHTVFSDGEVWPTVRIDEAAKEGLDAIAITDHVEYQPNKEYIPVDLNAAWKIAGEEARKKNILLVHGAEITRKMPPGHFNALFIEDAAKLTDKDFLTAVGEAVKQGAFIQWNHPGWKAQRPKGDTHLDSIHTVLLDKKWMNGIEIANDVESYQGVLPLCLENHLAVMANSDIHAPFDPGYYPGANPHRPVTLVFAKGRSLTELREALFAGRTLAWFGDSLAGNREYAAPFVLSCLEIGKIYYKNDKYNWREITNRSDIPFELTVKNGDATGAAKKISLPPNSKVRLRMPVGQGGKLECAVTNVRIADNQPLEITLGL